MEMLSRAWHFHRPKGPTSNPVAAEFIPCLERIEIRCYQGITMKSAYEPLSSKTLETAMKARSIVLLSLLRLPRFRTIPVGFPRHTAAGGGRDPRPAFRRPPARPGWRFRHERKLVHYRKLERLRRSRFHVGPQQHRRGHVQRRHQWRLGHFGGQSRRHRPDQSKHRRHQFCHQCRELFHRLLRWYPSSQATAARSRSSPHSSPAAAPPRDDQRADRDVGQLYFREQ